MKNTGQVKFMASFYKLKKTKVRGLLVHNNRTADDGLHHTNEEIDLSKTIFNYHFKKGNYEDAKARIEGIYHSGRKDEIVMAEMVITLPKDVKKEDERYFFQNVYNFYVNDFGEENIVNAVVHKDETTPHMHLDFIPVVQGRPKECKNNIKHIKEWEEKHGEITEKICCKECITYRYLQAMHKRLYDYIAEKLGYECEILNGATDHGARTVLQLKNEKLEKEVNELYNKQQILIRNIQKIQKVCDKQQFDTRFFDSISVINTVERLQQLNDLYFNIIKPEHETLPRQVIEQINKIQRQFPTNHNLNLINAKMTGNLKGITVIEMKQDLHRILPQRRIIESDPELEMYVSRLSSLTRTKEIKTNKGEYILFPTNTQTQIFENLIALSRLREYEEINIQKIRDDEYEISLQILNAAQIPVNYYIPSTSFEITDGRLRQHSKILI